MIAAVQGDFGKPRPAVVVQNNAHAPESAFVVIAFATSTISSGPGRLQVPAGAATGLSAPSELRLDQLYTVRREKVGKVIGRLPEMLTPELDRALAYVLGLLDRTGTSSTAEVSAPDGLEPEVR